MDNNTPEIKSYNEDEFYNKYQPITAPDGGETWDYSQLKDGILEHQLDKIKNVWSLVDTGDPDHNGAFALPGYHVVNVFGYCLTKVPWEDENVEGEWFAHDPERD